MHEVNKGLLVRCGTDGILHEIYHDSAFSNLSEYRGKLFTNLFLPDQIGKALDFLSDIRKNGAVFGKEMLPIQDISDKSFFFGGSLLEDGIIIFGSAKGGNSEKFLAGLMNVNNEQVNRIRELEKELREARMRKGVLDQNVYDDLTRLNNEMINMQRELAKKNRLLDEMNLTKNRFLGVAAHDLRNPLSNVLGFVECIEDESYSLSPEQAHFLSLIRSESWFMLNLIGDLLDVSVIESGDVKLKKTEVDLRIPLEEQMRSGRQIAEKKKISIYLEQPDSPVMVNIDYEKISRVIINLITNAVKFSNNGTKITVKLLSKGAEAVVSVRDEGLGINKEEIPLLFKSFQTTSTKSTSGEKSTGLGLFIVQGIISAHHGKVRVESEPGKGSTFYFSLPLV